MIRKLVSDFYINSIYGLTAKKVKSIGAKVLIVDLDNTLAPYFLTSPEEKTYSLISSYLKVGLEVIIITNNTYKRTYNYASKLNLDFICSARKPMVGKLRKYLVEHSIPTKGVLYIGDQVMNDMYMAKKLNIRCCLTNPLTKKDHFSTRLIRPIDLYLRKKYKKQGRLGINLEEDDNEREEI